MLNTKFHRSGTAVLEGSGYRIIDTTANARPSAKEKTKEWTAWQLYRRENPTWNLIQQFAGFVSLTLGIIGLIFGGLWSAQHLNQLIAPLAVCGGAVAIWRLK